MEMPTEGGSFSQRLDLSKFTEVVQQIQAESSGFLVGQEQVLELMFACLLCNGHILLEGVPGIAKTLTAKVMSKTIAADFSRIQFTPDLLPSDILGTSIFKMNTSEFVFEKGPIFSNVVLIDEINRAPAKTQSALFEVMEERQITIDGNTYIMEDPFIVIATQNPIEQEGTYRLPEAQLDRFLMKIKLSYLSKEQELLILNRYKDQLAKPDLSLIKSIVSKHDLAEIRETINQVIVKDQLVAYIRDIVVATREHGKIYLGASPRSSLALLQLCKVVAAYRGRDFVIPEDIQYLLPHVLNHRLILTPEAEMESLSPEDIIEEIIKDVEVPR